MKEICKCNCHIKGSHVLDFLPCCDICGQAYLDEDGTIDIEAYENCRILTEAERTKHSKFLSLVLRHKPEKLGLTLEQGGWVKLEDLLPTMHGKLTFESLKEVVKYNDKKRFEFSEDMKKIRASQGHSVNIDLGYEEVQPPEILYHGTVSKFLDSIYKKGICKGQRHHVHLSEDIETASNVGSRRGKAIILEVNAYRMHQNGFKFYKSTNGVWLTDHVPNEYFRATY